MAFKPLLFMSLVGTTSSQVRKNILKLDTLIKDYCVYKDECVFAFSDAI